MLVRGKKVSMPGFHVSQVTVLRPILIPKCQEVLSGYSLTLREAEVFRDFGYLPPFPPSHPSHHRMQLPPHVRPPPKAVRMIKSPL